MNPFLAPGLTKEMKVRYLERRFQDIVHCRLALDRSEFSTLARIAHQIKGNALSFDFGSLSPWAKDLEQAALVCNFSLAKVAIENLEMLINDLLLGICKEN